MKSKALSCALLCIFILFNACKESDDESKNPSPSPRLKQLTHYWGDSILLQLSYEYDQAWRLIKQTNSDGWSYQYTYAPGMVIEKKNYPNGSGVDTLLLNEKGFEISRSRGYLTTAYDQEGFIVKKIRHTFEPTAYFFTKENGNIVQVTEMDGDSYHHICNVQTMEYLPNSTNTIGPENMGMSFYGKQDPNLVSVFSYKAYGFANSPNPDEIMISVNKTYEYELDNQQRVIKKMTVGNPNDYYMHTYYD